MALEILAQEKVWIDKLKFLDLECEHYEKLSMKHEKNGIEFVAIDCEMVQTQQGRILARVSIVNSKGETIYDKFVMPTAKVLDYRTPYSGIRKKDIEHGEDFDKVQKEVKQILKNKLLVGHSLEHDLTVLKILHPQHMIRDTSTYSKFTRLTKGQKPSLKRLALHFLGATIQEGEHSSVQDAKAALELYILARKDWELQLINRKKSYNGSQGKLNYSANVQKKKKKDIKVEVIDCKQKHEKNGIEVVAIDCEMVGIQQGNMLARVSIVNSKGETIYDKFVIPTAKVLDYRTPYSGIGRKDIEHGEDFDNVQKEVKQILKNKLLVGHSLERDLRVLKILHPQHMIRDTSTYSKFTRLTKGQKPSLKRLALHFLGATIREGEHSSVQDAKAALELYILARKDWELQLINRKKSYNGSQGKLNYSANVEKKKKKDIKVEVIDCKQKHEKNGIEVVAIDCVMVGIQQGNMLARVSIVNSKGETIYDKFVMPTAKVLDYRTPYSGIRKKDIEHGEDFDKVQKEVKQILKNKLLVGHSLEHDLKVLKILHPQHMIRDTSTYSKFTRLTKGQKPSLKRLALHFLGATIREGEHSSVQDAKAALELYILARKDWESQLVMKKTGPEISINHVTQ